MHRILAFFLSSILLLPGISIHAQLLSHWEAAANAPVGISNNAVAYVQIGDSGFVYSFMGIDSTRIWSGITRNAYRLNTVTGQWSAISAVPGNVGRIAASAQGFRGKIYIFGGYSVDNHGNEITWPNVDIYDPLTDSYTRGTDAPVRVDDQVSGVWRDSLIYLISGWSTNHNVTNVQAYDPQQNSWFQATPIIGAPVFGHAGAISGDTIVYCDGVRVAGNFVINNASYMGIINPADPAQISWSVLPQHPGGAKYRMAAGVIGERVIFSGGTTNPYNFNGIGYNGVPSEPDDLTFGYNVRSGSWETYAPNLLRTMDHRGLAGAAERLYLVGGMTDNQQVTSAAEVFIADSVVVGLDVPATSPQQFALQQNYPNPFNPNTYIRFRIVREAFSTLTIFDVSGRVVRVLLNEKLTPGAYSLPWDGRDSLGRPVSSGIYLYRVQSGESAQVRKMVLLR